MPSEQSPREKPRDWREFLDSATAAAISATERAGVPRQVLDAMQRQVEVVQDLVERERRLQRDVAGRLIAPIDAAFDLLEGTGATLRRQAEALGAAGRALEETAALMQGQAEMFERTIAALRQPTELARAASGLERSARGSDRRRPSAAKPKARPSAAKPRARPSGAKAKAPAAHKRASRP
jgi:hypothetical protein